MVAAMAPMIILAQKFTPIQSVFLLTKLSTLWLGKVPFLLCYDVSDAKLYTACHFYAGVDRAFATHKASKDIITI